MQISNEVKLLWTHLYKYFCLYDKYFKSAVHLILTKFSHLEFFYSKFFPMAIGYKLTPWKVKFFLIYSATKSFRIIEKQVFKVKINLET